MQYFKGDATEKKFDNSASPIIDQIGMQLDAFFEGAYDAMPLGDLLHEGVRSPLANAIVLPIFREFFNTLYNEFRVSGSFESYLVVFRKIFGDEVEVEFTVSAPGKLAIAIIADQLELSNLVLRRIVDNAYLFDSALWYDDLDSGHILLQTVKGFHSQYELEQMLFEMVPAGIFTDIDLTFGA